jgi:regulator of sigma E protease
VTGLLLAIGALSFLIFFHELGHYLVAKVNRVKVELFSIGFGKPFECWEGWGTRWCIAPILLGGFVKMKGEEEGEKYDPDAFYGISPWRRITILLGGPLFNLLLALLLFYIVGLIGVRHLAPVVGKTLPGTPAAEVLKPGDRILEVNHHPVKVWEDLSRYISNAEKVELKVERGGQILEVNLTPVVREGKNIFGEPIKYRIIGIAPGEEFVTIRYNPVTALQFAVEEFKQSALLIWKGLVKLITGAIGLENLSGPIGIVDASAKVWQVGIVPFLLFTGLLSVNLGILNLLPIPVLDGGQILFQLYEGVTGVEPDQRVVEGLTYLGIALLIVVMGIGVYNDISRLIGG